MYSNCLVEVIKAKIKDPKAVRIIYLPKKWNNGARHFMWIKGDKVYHYTHEESVKGGILFKGFVKVQDLETFEAFILHRLGNKWKINKEEVGRKLRFPSIKKEGYLNWSRYWPEEELTDFPEKNKICKYVLISDKSNQVRSVKIEDLKKEEIKYMDWKYLSPYDDCWKILGYK